MDKSASLRSMAPGSASVYEVITSPPQIKASSEYFYPPTRSPDSRRHESTKKEERSQNQLVHLPVLSEADLSHMWLGTFTWLNQQTKHTSEVRIQLTTSRLIQAKSWPSAFEIEVVEQQNALALALDTWANRSAPTVCQVSPYFGATNTYENAFRYQCLSTLIHVNDTYAIGRRAPAAENDQPLIVLFPLDRRSGQLGAAVLPETGLSEFHPTMRPPYIGVEMFGHQTSTSAHPEVSVRSETDPGWHDSIQAKATRPSSRDSQPAVQAQSENETEDLQITTNMNALSSAISLGDEFLDGTPGSRPFPGVL